MKMTGNGSWQHCPRSGNVAAHMLAHSKMRWNEREVWIDRPPVFIIDQLQLDCVTASSD
ncbi:unnamed protein product [Linum tenue]|uniref:RNase H type-1 domain-containing protein n=1 Tax=Linum tenue TaxID=586396 RepID=A0AAV0MHD8_9ROSI|nr:unnamed protein product [Linum tenue]